MTDIAALSAPRIEASVPAAFDTGRVPIAGKPFSHPSVLSKAQVRKGLLEIIMPMSTRTVGWFPESPPPLRNPVTARRLNTGLHLRHMVAEKLPQLSIRIRPAAGDLCAD
jgi:hypothetical protein